MSFWPTCHVMGQYGKSLYVDDASYIPAAHFQNARIPRDEACYTCHTDYTIFGTFNSKLRGLHHIYVQYVTKRKFPLKLYDRYNNRECLHCHEGSRSFEEGAVHTADPQTMADIKSNKMSCTSSGCHDTIHNVKELDQVKYWEAGGIRRRPSKSHPYQAALFRNIHSAWAHCPGAQPSVESSAVIYCFYHRRRTSCCGWYRSISADFGEHSGRN